MALSIYTLGGEAVGDERLGRGRGSFFLDLGEQPGLDLGSRALSFRMIMSKTAGFQGYGAQLGDAAATRVVEVDKRKAGAGHRILQERDHRFCRKAILAAQMEKSADKAVAARPSS